jgi:hypothetical protein
VRAHRRLPGRRRFAAPLDHVCRPGTRPISTRRGTRRVHLVRGVRGSRRPAPRALSLEWVGGAPLYFRPDAVVLKSANSESANGPVWSALQFDA